MKQVKELDGNNTCDLCKSNSNHCWKFIGYNNEYVYVLCEFCKVATWGCNSIASIHENKKETVNDIILTSMVSNILMERLDTISELITTKATTSLLD